MEILNQLSSKQGDKTEKSNKRVAEQCIQDPTLLHDITSGFSDKDKKLQSDCIEVFTMISESHPDLVLPYANNIVPLLKSRETKTRWEAVHTFAFIADKIPEIIRSILPDLEDLIEKDKSTIVRDYTLDTISNFSRTGKASADSSFPILKKALNIWEEKHAKQVFKGFTNILENLPDFKAEIQKITRPYLNAKKKVVVTEAKKLMKR